MEEERENQQDIGAMNVIDSWIQRWRSNQSNSLCHGGYVEERIVSDHHHHQQNDGGSDCDCGISLWAPILLSMMNSPRCSRRRSRQLGFDDENEENRRLEEMDSELRRQSSAALLHFIQSLQAGIASESENNEEAIGGDNNNSWDPLKFYKNPSHSQ